MNGLQYILVVFLAVTQHSGLAKKPECIGDWRAIHRACYRFDETPMTWADASASCTEHGGELISISSKGEFNKIIRAIQTRLNTDKMLTWWIGLKRNTETSKFDWLDGNSFSSRVTQWAPGEPNNRRNAEDCAEFKFDGKLNDKNCNNKNPYVCEYVEITARPIQTTAQATTQALTTTATTILTSTTTPATTLRVVTTPKPTTPLPSTENVPKPVEETGAVTDSVRPVQQTVSTTTKKAVMPEEDLTIYKDCFNYDKIVKSRKMKKSQLSANMIHLVDDQTCPPMEASDISWPETGNGQLASVPCKKGSGTATFLCGVDPVCWRNAPDVSGCASPKLQQLFKRTKWIFQAKNNSMPESTVPQETSVNETLEVTEILAKATSGNDISVADVMLTCRVFENLAKTKFTKGGKKNAKKMKNIVMNVVKAGSNMVSKNKTATWTDMTPEDKMRSATTLLASMESATATMADSLDHPIVIETKDENIDMQIRVVNISEYENKPMVFGEEEESDVKFSIPKETLAKLSKGGLAKVVFMTHYKMADILDDKQTDETVGETVLAPKIASYIFSATLGGGNQNKLPEPITFIMKHVQSFPANSVPLCSFLNMSEGSHGSWSQDGCIVVSSDVSKTTCQCDHLTNFAILMDVKGVEMASVHNFMLRFITLVGCIISLICLFISFITFNWFSSIQGERNSIHKNLVFCLFVAELLFLVGIDQTENKLVCSLIAGFLHYFFLTAFTWMFLEGLHIICMLVQVFDAAKSRLPYYYFVGYGFPLAIVAVSAGVFHQGYGTDTFCWLTTDRSFIWSFAGPVAVVLAVNAMVLIYAMSTVCRHAEYVFSNKDKNNGDMRAWIQGAMAIEVILGLTWVFGYCYISQETIALAYIFTILNSLQGLFIFCFHCLLNKKVIKEYKTILHITKRPASSAQTTSLMRKPGTSNEMSQPTNTLTHSSNDSRA